MKRTLLTLVAACCALALLATPALADPGLGQPKPPDIPQPDCVIGSGGGQTSLTLSGSTAIVNVQYAFCGQQTTATIRWSNGRTVSGTSDQVALAAGQCISVSVDVYDGPDFWTTDNAGPVCAPTGGSGSGSGSGGTTPTDTDKDGVPDATDNCRTVANGPLAGPLGFPSQSDADGNGVGDACQTSFPATTDLSEAAVLDQPTGYCSLKDYRCLSSASASTKCQSGHDKLWFKEIGTTRTVFHQGLDITLCFIPGRGFTGVKGTPRAYDLTCGSVCTYPYKTGGGTVSVNYPNLQRAVVTVDWTVSECILFWGPGCTFDVPISLTTTWGVNGTNPPYPPATGTQTLSMFKVSSTYHKGI